MLLRDITTDALKRLDDEANEVWSRAELDLYGRDGYDLFARRSKCIWDIVVLPNISPTGGYGSDLQRYISEHTPGARTADRRILITRSGERDTIQTPIAAVDAVPIAASDPSQASAAVGVWRLPDGVVAVFRVAWDRQTLVHTSPQELRRRDNVYETREGDPQAWLWDADGLMALRVWPAADGDATYNTVNGRGFLRATDDATRTLDTSKFSGRKLGFIRRRSDGFPARSHRVGFIRRSHPETNNVKVEVARLGRNPETFHLELPRTFEKYIVFYAMHRALNRAGKGQDKRLAKHFLDRFELGVTRMQARIDRALKEKMGDLGGGSDAPRDGQLRIALPAWWGPVTRR